MVHGELVQLEREVPALGDDPDGAVGQIVDLELRLGVEDAQAVRPHEDGAGGPDPVTDRLFPAGAVFSRLAQAGAQHDDRPGACRKGVVDHLLERRGLHGHDHEIGWLGQ